MQKRITPKRSADYWRTSTWKGRKMSTPISKTNPGAHPHTSSSQTVKSPVPAGGEVPRDQYAGKDPSQARDERQGQA
jgi:hypothetical protein